MKKIVLFLIISILISFSANAQFCNKYADKAVSQYQLAKKNNLPNINWSLWTDDWNGHLIWCKSVSHDVANKETAKRQAYLDKYIKNNKNQTKEDFCNTYADDAVNQYNKAKQLLIPQGPEWSSDRNEHYQWCMQVPENVAKDRQALRKAIISEYLGAQRNSQTPQATDNKGNTDATWSGAIPETQDMNSINLQQFKEKTCKYYAEESVKQNKQNISQGYRIGKEPEWSSDYKAHYNWCMHGNNYKTADNTLKSRNQKLAKCSKSTSVAMTKIGGRSAFGTSMATTYMDMHNMFMPHKNNCSSSEAFVPLWQGAELGFCIDKNYHTHPWGKSSWSDAIRTCLSENKRLPELWEWQIANNDRLINLDRKNHSFEWGSNFPIPMNTDTSNGMAVPVLGYGDFDKWGFISSSDISSLSGYRGSNYFRCVH